VGDFIVRETDSVYCNVEDVALDTSDYYFIAYSSIKEIDVAALRDSMKASPTKGIVLYKKTINASLSITNKPYKNAKVGDQIILKTLVKPSSYAGTITWRLNSDTIGVGAEFNLMLTQAGKFRYLAFLENANCVAYEIHVVENNTNAKNPVKAQEEKPKKHVPIELAIQLQLDRITWTKGYDSYTVRIKRESSGSTVWKEDNYSSNTLLISRLRTGYVDNTLYIIEIQGSQDGVLHNKIEQQFWLIENQTKIDPKCIKPH